MTYQVRSLLQKYHPEYLLKSVEEDVKHDTAKLIKELENKAKEEADKKVEKANKLVKQMVCKMYEDGFSLEQISEYCSLNVDEIQVLIKS